MKKYFGLAAIAMIALLAISAAAQLHPYTPEKGSPQRKAILDAVRKYRKAPSEVYSPTAFRVLNSWALVSARDPSDPDVDTEAFSVILRRTAGKWKVVDELRNIEGTDVADEIKRVHKKYPSLPMVILDVN